MKLVSDFRDYYDHSFDGTGKEFSRMMTDGPDRRSMLEMLQCYAFPVPWFGPVYKCPDNIRKIVVFDDIKAHRGEGKRLVDRLDVVRDSPLSFCSEYVGSGFPEVGEQSVSFRYLQIGLKSFWIRYHSVEDWRSNVGDGDICIIPVIPSGFIKFPEPEFLMRIFKRSLFAIDFIQRKFFYGPEMIAVDYNVSPGIRGTGVQNRLTGKEIVFLIEEAELKLSEIY